MPDLSTFVLCEKAIVARDYTISLITLFQGITLTPDFEIPEASPTNPMGIALPWTAYSVWRKEETDENKTFEQRLCVVTPDKIRLILSLVDFSITGYTHTTLVPLLAWPIASVGVYEVILEIREKRKGSRFKKGGSSLINVHRGEISAE
ncbi:MAG: hypothetical protein ABJA50_05630 [Chloroflexota bacterium]